MDGWIDHEGIVHDDDDGEGDGEGDDDDDDDGGDDDDAQGGHLFGVLCVLWRSVCCVWEWTKRLRNLSGGAGGCVLMRQRRHMGCGAR